MAIITGLLSLIAAGIILVALGVLGFAFLASLMRGLFK